jgi:diguanylate cyclase (GGDEF)-like protein
MREEHSYPISQEQRGYLAQWIVSFKNHFDLFVDTVGRQIPYFEHTTEIADVYAQMKSLEEQCTRQRIADVDTRTFISEKVCGFLKRVVMYERRQRAIMLEAGKEKTVSSELQEILEGKLKPLAEFLELEWLRNVAPMRMPRLGDYLSREATDRSSNVQMAAREYDEKFHILQAPRLFLPDLHYYRQQCEARGTSVVAVFIDIDDFKRLNTSHQHTKVDRNVLPDFMRCVECHFYCHGFAYRQGGDEYEALLPNMSSDLASEFLEELRAKVAQIKYRDVVDRTTVSIGYCEVGPDSIFTDREVEERANRAMIFAKDGGKNRVATFVGELIDQNLRVLPTASGG